MEADKPATFERFRRSAAALLALPELRTVAEIDEMILGTEEAEAMLLKALEQVAAEHGQSESDPLCGLGIAGFYLLMRSCDYEVVGQSTRRVESGGMLDTMTIVGEDLDGSHEVVVYNLVMPEPPSA